jgi:hypothetical protein
VKRFILRSGIASNRVFVENCREKFNHDGTYTRLVFCCENDDMRPSWEPLLPGKWIAIIFAVGAAVTVSLALLGLTDATVFAGMITILIVAALSNGSV